MIYSVCAPGAFLPSVFFSVCMPTCISQSAIVVALCSHCKVHLCVCAGLVLSLAMLLHIGDILGEASPVIGRREGRITIRGILDMLLF